MPDGYRRGGSYQRGGRTYYRRGTKIKPPSGALLGLAGGVIALTALTGGSLVGSPVLIVGVSALVVGFVIYKNRRRLRPLGRMIQRKAAARYKKRNTRPALVARANHKKTVVVVGPDRGPQSNTLTRTRRQENWQTEDRSCVIHDHHDPACETCQAVAAA